MFGLENLTFKTKIIIVSVMVIIISMGVIYIRNTYPISVVKIDDWVFIVSNDEGNYYYKSNLVNIDDQSHIITVWIKIVYTEKGKQKFLKTHNEDQYHEIYRSLSKVLIDYQEGKYHEDRVIHYSKSGNILGSEELYVKNNEIIPKFVGDKMLAKIIEDHNIKR